MSTKRYYLKNISFSNIIFRYRI